MSFADAVSEFIAAMEREGLKPTEPIAGRLASGELIRFHCEGDGKGRQNGWAKLYIDERPAGAFGNYRLGISRKWAAGGNRTLSALERAAMQREWAEAKEKRLEERERSEVEAAHDAIDMWERAARASASHPYLRKKGIDHACLRQLGEMLLIPMYDASGRMWNLQRVFPDGRKRFLRGGRTAGLFNLIGVLSRRGETTCIGEGYATMHAVHRATGYPAIATFSAKNLAPVARIWFQSRPDLDLVVCADDDAHLPINIGLDAARSVSDEIGARLATPPQLETA